ncbi:hypothetical protein HID58_048347, partial [Brassica napus]
HMLPSVEPFGVPSRSIGQHRGNRTFVGRVVLQFRVLLAGLKYFPFVILDVKQQYFSVPGLGEYGLTWSHASFDDSF